MTVFKHSYSDLRACTGLDPDFIRRLMRAVTELKLRHTQKGERGELLFDDQALHILQQVAQMRADKRPFKGVTEWLADALGSPTSPLPLGQADSAQTDSADKELALAKALIEELKHSHQLVLTAQQARIADLQQQLQLLTDGKDPFTIQQERQWQQARLLQLEREQAEAQRLALQAAEKLQHEQAQVLQLKANLEKVRSEAAHLIKDFQDQKLAARERTAHRALLLEQLDQLSWVQSGRKRELLTLIRELA